MPRIKRSNNGTLINTDFNNNKSIFDTNFSGTKSNFDINLNKNIEVIISHLRAELVPRRLQDFITIDEKDITDNSYLYVDNNGTDSKIPVTSIANAIDYEKLKNIPSIEGVKLIGNKNFPDFGLDNIDYDYIANLK